VLRLDSHSERHHHALDAHLHIHLSPYDLAEALFSSVGVPVAAE
jgi:hypothetical protein